MGVSATAGWDGTTQPAQLRRAGGFMSTMARQAAPWTNDPPSRVPAPQAQPTETPAQPAPAQPMQPMASAAVESSKAMGSSLGSDLTFRAPRRPEGLYADGFLTAARPRESNEDAWSRWGLYRQNVRPRGGFSGGWS